MSIIRNTCTVMIVAVILSALQCGNRKHSDLPRAAIIVGDVKVSRNGQMVPVAQDLYLRPGDTVQVDENSKIKFELKGDGIWYLGNNTKIVLGDPVAISEVKRRLQVTLLEGQMYIVKKSEQDEEYSVTTNQWTIRVTSADVNIGAGNPQTSCCVILLRGFSTFVTPGKNETILPECTKLSYTGSGPGELQPITLNDITELKSWIGPSVIDDALSNSACKQVEDMPPAAAVSSATNRPPEWIGVPEGSALVGEKVVDTLFAKDPEQEPVTYQILEGFNGMKLNPKTGVVSYTASAPGEFDIKVSASDPQGASCTTSIHISISAGLSLRLIAPSSVKPGAAFAVSAKINNKNIDKNSLVYRFDLNGDGVFESPGKGTYGKKNSYPSVSLPSEGVLRLRVEARTGDGQVARAAKLVIVNNAPEPVFVIKPQLVQVGAPVLFDVTASKDTRNGNIPLNVRYDVNHDGIYEIPANRDVCTSDKPYQFTFNKAGVHTVSALLTDKDGATSTATATVTVSNGIQGGIIEAPETIPVNTPVTFSCTGFNAETSIKDFSWEITGVTVASKEKVENKLKAVFKSDGKAVVSCVVTDDKKQNATIKKEITITDAATEVRAGGPYKGQVNSPVTLVGTAMDNDTRITNFAWDFEGDGKIDWSSAKDMKTEHVYLHAGTYNAVFSITGEDGKTVKSTAVVTISNKAPKADAGENIVSRKNRKVELNGTGTDEDGTVALYEWDFNSDGTFDWSSKETGTVTHQFPAYSKAVLKVTDSDGEYALDTVSIIICPEGMETMEEGQFCIDRYEYPNKKNAVPRVDVTYKEAENLCAQQGKRLCTAEEWETACKSGREKNNYPYGKKYDVDKCNTLGNPRVKNSIAPSADFVDCKGNSGLYDMSGNVAEWVKVSQDSHFAYGGSWQNGEEGSSCGSRVKLQKDKKFFYTGLRCCK